MQTGAKPNLRTSLVIDPADGKDSADDTRGTEAGGGARRGRARRRPLARTWRDDRGTRLVRVPRPRRAVGIAPYGSNYHIVQSSDCIVMSTSGTASAGSSRSTAVRTARHSVRLHRRFARPLGGRHARRRDDQLHAKRNFSGSPGTPPAVAMTPAFHLTERFTRTAEDTIVHTYTVEDPTTWTRPWTVEMPMHRIKGPMLEYACNENNEDAFTTLRNARAQEAGKLPPPDRTRNVADPKATIIQREEKSDGAKK